MTPTATAILVSAYGSAPTLSDDDVYGYLRHIIRFYRGVDPEPDLFDDLKHRFSTVGVSPIYSATESVARNLQGKLDTVDPGAYQVRFAMKHSPPHIEDVAREITDDGFTSAISVPLAPFRSRLSTGGYHKLAAESSGGGNARVSWKYVDGWHLDDTFLEMWTRKIGDALSRHGDDLVAIFTNHSLPVQVRDWGDPYETDFQATSAALAERCKLDHWGCAFQSKGGGETDWLKPELVDVLRDWGDRGYNRFLVVPVGFLTAHLEISYDIDVVASRVAEEMGLELVRTDMPDDDPLLVQTLRDRVVEAAANG